LAQNFYFVLETSRLSVIIVWYFGVDAGMCLICMHKSTTA